MMKRSRDKQKKEDMTSYYFVYAFFLISCAGLGIYVLVNPE